MSLFRVLDSTNALFKAQVVGRLVDGVEMRYWLCTSDTDGHQESENCKHIVLMRGSVRRFSG